MENIKIKIMCDTHDEPLTIVERECEEDVITLYVELCEKCRDDVHSSGYNDGRNDGYDDGYSEGETDCLENNDLS